MNLTIANRSITGPNDGQATIANVCIEVCKSYTGDVSFVNLICDSQDCQDYCLELKTRFRPPEF